MGQPMPAVAVAYGLARPGIPAGEEPDTPQGSKAPLHGAGGKPAAPGTPGGRVKVPMTTRAEIINRAKKGVAAQVPYSRYAHWPDGYRKDCSGYVSMAWNLPGNEWTGSLGTFGVRISRDRLQPGDILLFRNMADPEKGSHVVLFGGWTDYTHTYDIAYEQTRRHARRQATPHRYWRNSDRYVPYRYNRPAGSAGVGPGAVLGAGAKTTPSGYPGPETWRRLFS
ncbi:NlpC/P60 family protein [Streptomyces sp. SD15]